MIGMLALERRRPGTEPVILVAQHRPDGGILLLGRSLYSTRCAVPCSALAIGVGPTILALFIGALFSLQATRRFKSIQLAIDRMIQGDFSNACRYAAAPTTSTRSSAPSISCSTRFSGSSAS